MWLLGDGLVEGHKETGLFLVRLIRLCGDEMRGIDERRRLPIDSMDYAICGHVIGLEDLRRVDVGIISEPRDSQIVPLVTLQYCPIHKAWAI